MIRAARAGDVRQLVALVAACFDPAWSEAALASALAAPGACSWLAEPLGEAGGVGASGALQGFVLARAIVDVLEIDLVGVAPGARRRGLARALLTAAIEAAQRAGCAQARLELSARNEAAARLYAELGFVVVGRRPRYYPDGSDALLLSRALTEPAAAPDRETSLSSTSFGPAAAGLGGADAVGGRAPCLPVRSRAQVLANGPEGSGRRLRLAVPGWPGSRPGQFLMLGPGAEGSAVRRDPLLPRPMAIYRELPGEGAIEVLYRVVGRGTALIGDLRVGDPISLVGPLGRGFAEVLADAPVGSLPTSGAVFLVGGGSGIASLYAWARLLAAAGRRVVVLLGGRSRGDLLGWSDFEALGVELVATTEDGTQGLRGLVTEPLAARLAAEEQAVVHAVGPTPMMRACASLAAERGVPCFVSLENPMACGFGVCLGCAAPRRAGGYALVCRTGPVFDAAEIDWAGLP